VPYHCTAVGKVLIAFGAADLPAAPLEALTPLTIVDRDALAAEVATVRRDGCAIAMDELEVGLSSLAAPVFGAGHEVLAALAISGPTLRLNPERVAELCPQLIHEAQALGARLGDHDKGAKAA
jgi:IclR family transcriptional regulator, acetate operon repressor